MSDQSSLSTKAVTIHNACIDRLVVLADGSSAERYPGTDIVSLGCTSSADFALADIIMQTINCAPSKYYILPCFNSYDTAILSKLSMTAGIENVMSRTRIAC